MEETATNIEEVVEDVAAFTADGIWQTLLVAAAILVVTGILSRILTVILTRIFGEEDPDDPRGRHVLPTGSIFIHIIRVCLWVVGASVLLSTCCGIDVSGAITALGVGGIAVSLGAQDTISNLIGGLQISLMGIVKPGDHIEVGGQRGVVDDVTWRHTAIHSEIGNVIIIPNSVINSTALIQLPPQSTIRMDVVVTNTSEPLNEVAARVCQLVTEAVSPLCTLQETPQLLFGGVSDYGYLATLKIVCNLDAPLPAIRNAAIYAAAPHIHPKGGY